LGPLIEFNELFKGGDLVCGCRKVWTLGKKAGKKNTIRPKEIWLNISNTNNIKFKTGAMKKSLMLYQTRAIAGSSAKYRWSNPL